MPPGFNQQLFQQLVDIVQAYHLSATQVNWLMSHTSFVPIIWNAHEAGETGAIIVPTLNFAMANNLTGDQYQFLIKNPTVFQAIAGFLSQHPGDSKANEIVNGLLLFIQSLEDLTLSDLNFLYDSFDGIEEATSDPMNPPITATRPICADILTFATLTDAQNNFQYTGMHLTDGYYAFTVPGLGLQEPFHIKDMHMIVNAYSANVSCLPSTASMAADAINLAVSQTQQLFNSLPPTPPSQNTLSGLKAALLRSMDREFRNIVTSCNSLYTSSMYVYGFGESNPNDGLPINNIDVKSPVCP